MKHTRLSDEELLSRIDRDPDCAAVFYRRHERTVLAFFARATGRGDLAVDLAAETFVRVLEGRASFDPAKAGALAWLFGIARHVLYASFERGRVEASARVRAGMTALTIDDRLAAEVEALADAGSEAEAWLDELPGDQRLAIEARVLNERSYTDIAAQLKCSEAVVRKRVSRGLSNLRRELEGLT